MYFLCVCECLCVMYLCHQLSILGMDACDGPDVLTGLQCLVQLRVPQHHHVFVGHEHLEGVDPMFPHQGLHLVTHLITVQRSGLVLGSNYS